MICSYGSLMTYDLNIYFPYLFLIPCEQEINDETDVVLDNKTKKKRKKHHKKDADFKVSLFKSRCALC